MDDLELIRRAFDAGPDLDARTEERIRLTVFAYLEESIAAEEAALAELGLSGSTDDYGDARDAGLPADQRDLVMRAFAAGPDLDVFTEARLRASVFDVPGDDALEVTPVVVGTGDPSGDRAGDAARVHELELEPVRAITTGADPSRRTARTARAAESIGSGGARSWRIAVAAASVLIALLAALVATREGSGTGPTQVGVASPTGSTADVSPSSQAVFASLIAIASSSQDRPLGSGQQVFFSMWIHPTATGQFGSQDIRIVDRTDLGTQEEADLVATDPNSAVMANTPRETVPVGTNPVRLGGLTYSQIRSIEPTIAGIDAAILTAGHTEQAADADAADVAMTLLALPVTPPPVKVAVLEWLQAQGYVAGESIRVAGREVGSLVKVDGSSVTMVAVDPVTASGVAVASLTTPSTNLADATQWRIVIGAQVIG